MTPGKINTSLHDDNESSLAHETSIKNENSNLEHKIINNKKLNSNSHNGSDGIDISDSDKNEPINCKDEKLKMEVMQIYKNTYAFVVYFLKIVVSLFFHYQR